MLAVTNKWLDATSGRSIAAVLHKALRGCLDKLTATFKAFVQSQVGGDTGAAAALLPMHCHTLSAHST